MENNKLVLFDIDGTIVKARDFSARDSFPKAIKKIFGLDTLIDWKKYDGTVDRYIFTDILRQNKIPEEKILEKLEDLFEERYNFFYQNMEKDYRKRLIKEAKELLVKLVKNKIFVGLLTGNVKAVARLKMETIGLDKYLRFGLYGSEADDRISLAKSVFKKAKNFFGIDFLAENVYVIGDTGKDIECGKAIGVKTIAVATGFWPIKELKKVKPDLAVNNLADKRVLKFIVG